MHLYRKTFVVMRMTIALLTAVCLQASAVGYSQKLMISLTVRQRPLETVFRDIKAQTGYVFWYKLDILQYARTVTVDLRGQDLTVVLDSVFNHQPLTYTIIGKTIAVKLKEGADLPPPITVIGKVTDEKGVPRSEPESGDAVSLCGVDAGEQ